MAAGRSALACTQVVRQVLSVSLPWRQVFGEVTKGMDVVKTVETYGSQSGALSWACLYERVLLLSNTLQITHVQQLPVEGCSSQLWRCHM